MLSTVDPFVLSPEQAAARKSRLDLAVIRDAFDEARLRHLVAEFERSAEAFAGAKTRAAVAQHVRAAVGVPLRTHPPVEVDDAEQAHGEAAEALAHALDAVAERHDLESLWRQNQTTRFRLRVPANCGCALTIDGDVITPCPHHEGRY